MSDPLDFDFSNFGFDEDMEELLKLQDSILGTAALDEEMPIEERPGFTVPLFQQQELDTTLPQEDASALRDILNIQDQLTREDNTYGLTETAARATYRGFQRLGSTLFDLVPALGSSWLAERAEAIGITGAAEDLRRYALSQIQENEATEADIERMNPAEFKSYKQVSSPYEALKFAFQVAPEQAANMFAVIGTSLVTKNPFTAIATAYGKRATAGKVTKEVAEKASLRGLMAASGMGSFALNAPEVFNNIYQETGELAPGMALLGGAVAASLDSVLPYQITKSFVANPALKRAVVSQTLLRSGSSPSVLASAGLGMLKGLGKGAAIEGPTEAAQEAVSITAERIVSDNWSALSSEDFDRLVESAVQGAVGGGGISSVAGGVSEAYMASSKKKARDTRAEGEERVLPSVGVDSGVVASLLTPDATPAQVQRFTNLGFSPTDVERFGVDIEPTEAGRYSVEQANEILTNKATAIQNRRNRETVEDIELHRDREEEGNASKKATLTMGLGYGFLDNAAIDAYEVASQDPNILLEPSDFTDQNLDFIANREPGTPIDGQPTLNLFSAKDVKDLSASKMALLDPVTSRPVDQSGAELWNVNRDIEKARQTPTTESATSESRDRSDFYDLREAKVFAPGSKNLDLSSGRYRETSDVLSEDGVTNFRFDPAEAVRDEGRVEEGGQRITEQELRDNVDQVRDGQADTATIFGQLGATKNLEDRVLLLERAKNALKPNGELFITVDGGNKTGKGAATSEGWQNNKPLEAYIPEIAEVFGIPQADLTIETQGNTSFVRVSKQPKAPVGYADRPEEIEEASIEDLMDVRFSPVLDNLGNYIQAWNVYKTDQTEENKTAYEASKEALLNTVKEGSPVPTAYQRTLAVRNGVFTSNLDNYLMFSSFAAAAPVTYTSVERLNEVVNELYGPDVEVRSRVEIFNKPEDVPGRTDLDPRARGIFTTDKRIYLFASNIEVGNEVGVVMHETGGHLGILNQDSPKVVRNLFNTIERFATKTNSFESEVANLAKERVKMANTPQELVELETIAYFIEEAVNRGVNPIQEARASGPLASFFNRLVNMFKQALRAIGINIAPSARDIVDMAYGAAKKPLKLPLMKLTNIERDLYSISGIDQVPKGTPTEIAIRLATKEGARGKSWFDRARFMFTELPIIGWEIENEYAFSSPEMQRLAGELAAEVELIDRLNNARLNGAQRYLEGARFVTFRLKDNPEEIQQSAPFNYTDTAEIKRKSLVERLKNDDAVDPTSIQTTEEGWFIANVRDEGGAILKLFEGLTYDKDGTPLESKFTEMALEASRLQVPFYSVDSATIFYTGKDGPTSEPLTRNPQDTDFNSTVNQKRFEIEAREGVVVDSVTVQKNPVFTGISDEDTRRFKLDLDERINSDRNVLADVGRRAVTGETSFDTVPAEEKRGFKRIISRTNITNEEVEQIMGEKESDLDTRLGIFNKAKESFKALSDSRIEFHTDITEFFQSLYEYDPALTQRSVNFLDSLEAAYALMPRTLQAELESSFGETKAAAIMEAANIPTLEERGELSPFYPLTRDGEFSLQVVYKDSKVLPIVTHHETAEELIIARDEANKDPVVKEALAMGLPDSKANPETSKAINEMEAKLEKLDLDSEDRQKVAVLVEEIRSKMLPLGAFEERTKIRRGYPGYNSDLITPLIKIGNASSNQLAAFLARSELNKSFESMERIVTELTNESLKPSDAPAPGSVRFAKDVLNELNKRRKYMENPVNAQWANWASTATFRYFLAATPSSALVNTTSAWTIGLGILAEQYGFTAALEEIGKASAIALRNGFKRMGEEGIKYTAAGTDARALDDITLFDDDLIYEDAEARDLASDAKKSGAERASFRPDVEKVSDLDPITSRAGDYMRKAMTAVGWMFQQSERMSKQVVLKAAYELERKKQREINQEEGKLAAYLEKQVSRYTRISERKKGSVSQDDPNLPAAGSITYSLSLAADKYKARGINSPVAKELARRAATSFVFRIQSTGIRASGARLLQKDFGKVVGALRSYALLMMSLQTMIGVLGFKGAKAAYRGTKLGEGVKSPAEVALKLFFYTSVPTFLVAGIQGLPMYFVPEIFYSAMQMMDGDDEFEADETFDEFMANMLGSQSFVGKAAFVGPFSHLTDVSIYRRVGFNDLFMQDDPYRQERLGLPTYLAESSLGAALAILRRGIRGGVALQEGEFYEAITAAAPKAIADVLIGTDSTYGYNKKGDPMIEDVDMLDRITRVLGFGSTQARVNSLARQRMYRLKRKASDKKQAILLNGNMERMSAGIVSPATRQAIKRFNESGFSKIKGVGPITELSRKRSWNNFSKRRKTAEYAARKYQIAYPGLSTDEVDTLARALGLEGTINLDY